MAALGPNREVAVPMGLGMALGIIEIVALGVGAVSGATRCGWCCGYRHGRAERSARFDVTQTDAGPRSWRWVF